MSRDGIVRQGYAHITVGNDYDSEAVGKKILCKVWKKTEKLQQYIVYTVELVEMLPQIVVSEQCSGKVAACNS